MANHLHPPPRDDTVLNRESQCPVPQLRAIPKAMPGSRPDHVLVMDESIDLLDFYGAMFQDEGLTVTTTNSLMVLDQVRKLSPDVIVMEELFRHERQGHQLIRELRFDLECRSIPVICCTSLGAEQMPSMLRSVRTVQKPFDIDVLLGAIQEETVRMLRPESTVPPIANPVPDSGVFEAAW